MGSFLIVAWAWRTSSNVDVFSLCLCQRQGVLLPTKRDHCCSSEGISAFSREDWCKLAYCLNNPISCVEYGSV